MQNENGQDHEPVGVLLVDQGLSFGGALVVLVSIARNLDPAFRPIVVTAIKEDPEKWIDTDGLLVYSRTPSYTYIDHLKKQNYAKKIPIFALRKLYIYWASLIGFFANIRYSIQIYKLIKKHRVKVVHINGSIFVTLAAVLARVRCVWHIHGIPTRPPSLWKRLLLPWIDKYVSISDFVTQAATSRGGYPKEKLVTLHNPVSDPFIKNRQNHKSLSAEIREREGIQKDDFVVAVFGRIIKWKGQLEVVKAWAHLCDRPDIKLMLVGDASEGFASNYKLQIEDLIKRNGVHDRVIVTGFVREVYDYYKAADLIVHCSIAPEPFGLVVVEAMASGKPVIVSNLGATPELVDDGKSGFIIDPTDNVLMAETIRSLSDDRDLCLTMGEWGLATVHERFMPAQYGEAISKLYQELLKDQPSQWSYSVHQ